MTEEEGNDGRERYRMGGEGVGPIGGEGNEQERSRERD